MISMPKRNRLAKKGKRLLVDKNTGAVFSANPADYWNVLSSERLGKNLVLAQDVPVCGKGVIGGFKRVIVKVDPVKGDL